MTMAFSPTFTYTGHMAKCEPECTCGRHKGPWADRTRNRSLGIPYRVRERKMCPACNSEKLRSEFSPQPGRFTTAGRPILYTQCDKCRVARVIHLPSQTPEAKRARGLMKNYGLTVEQYDQMIERQGGTCALCPRSADSRAKRLHVDHDHATGKVRGLLCDQCNRAIGLLSDDPDRMRRAAAYVESGGFNA